MICFLNLCEEDDTASFLVLFVRWASMPWPIESVWLRSLPSAKDLCSFSPSFEFMLGSGHPARGNIPELYLSPKINTHGSKGRESGWAKGGVELRHGLSQGPGLLHVELWSGNGPQNYFQHRQEARSIGLHYQLPNAGYAGKGSVALAKVAFSPLQRQFCRGWTAECLLLPAPPAAGGRSPSLSQGDRSEGLSVVPTSTPHPNKDTQTWENETSVLISNPLTFKKRVNFFFLSGYLSKRQG